MGKDPIGVLILHGFASSLDSVRRLEAPIKALGVPTRMPLLRGHGGASPEALRGVTWHDWFADAHTELRALRAEADRAVIVGHSMGALLALLLAGDEPEAVDSLVLAATPVRLASPLAAGQVLHFLEPLVSRVLKKWDLPPVYAEPALVMDDTNYHWAPMDAISSFLQLSEVTRTRLGDVRAPALILHSRRDTTAAPKSVAIMLRFLHTPPGLKRVHWFEMTNHEMFQDCEREAVVTAAVDYVRERLARGEGG